MSYNYNFIASNLTGIANKIWQPFDRLKHNVLLGNEWNHHLKLNVNAFWDNTYTTSGEFFTPVALSRVFCGLKQVKFT